MPNVECLRPDASAYWPRDRKENGLIPKLPSSAAEAWSMGLPGIVVHDAGAASHILAWLRKSTGHEPTAKLFATGPARAIFGEAGLGFEPSVEHALRDCDWALVGTGWGTIPQHQAMRTAAKLGIPCLAVVDHWVNYELRFAGLAAAELPWGIVVTDLEALRIARRDLPWADVVIWQNQLLRDFGADYTSRKHAGEGSILWLNQPLIVNGQLQDPLSTPPLNEVVARVLESAARLHGSSELILRQHPSLPRGVPLEGLSWDSQLLSARWSEVATSLASEVAHASVVLGIDSYALYLSGHYHPDTYSVAAQIGQECGLPANVVRQWSAST